MYAAQQGQKTMLLALLNAGAIIDQVNHSGSTALMKAA
jgi:ankyrin repeat protein